MNFEDKDRLTIKEAARMLCTTSSCLMAMIVDGELEFNEDTGTLAKIDVEDYIDWEIDKLKQEITYRQERITDLEKQRGA